VIARLLLVGGGGFVGSILRYAVSGAVQRWSDSASFPWGTLSVNVLGCLVIGGLGGLADARQVLGPEARQFLMLGLLGGFTTFSTFGYETLTLMRDGQFVRATGNVVGTVMLCLFAVWLGYTLGSAR